MNKTGKSLAGFLGVLIVIAMTSATMFLLVRYGIVEVKERGETEVLNMDFIPFVREGYLVLEDFKFCDSVDEGYNCKGESSRFFSREEVYFRFIIGSSVSEGEVKLVENYRLKNPQGEVLLEAEQKDNYYFEMKSGKEKELVYFKDYFTLGSELEEGEYTFELLMENPLLSKKVSVVKKLEVKRGVENE